MKTSQTTAAFDVLKNINECHKKVNSCVIKCWKNKSRYWTELARDCWPRALLNIKYIVIINHRNTQLCAFGILFFILNLAFAGWFYIPHIIIEINFAPVIAGRIYLGRLVVSLSNHQLFCYKLTWRSIIYVQSRSIEMTRYC